jgi:hypothetical protein
MGAFVVVINAFAIYIAGFLSPVKIATVAEPTVSGSCWPP